MTVTDEMVSAACDAFLAGNRTNRTVGFKEIRMALEAGLSARVDVGEDPVERLVDVIRSRGWMVAVHNDYRLNGEPHTFWLFTKDGRAVKGEGRTDSEAIAHVVSAIHSVEFPPP